MSEVIDFEKYVMENTPHATAELICIHCKKRWIGVWPESVWLKDLTCPHCSVKGGVITTGQFLPEDYE